MSTSTYNLRTRAEAGVATQPRVRDDSSEQQSTPSPIQDLPPYIVGGYPPDPLTGRTTALYSDVVASRPSSPQKGVSSTTVAEPEVVPEGENIPIGCSVPDRATPVNKIIPSPDSGITFEVSVPEQDTGDAPWTTVRRRRACSLESFEQVQKSAPGSGDHRGLTKNQILTVKAAADTLTKGQKDTLHIRQEKLAYRSRNSSVSSKGEDMSRRKGKGIDPREWGNANLSQESLDVEAQEAALRSMALKKKLNKRNDEKEKRETYRAASRVARSTSVRLPAASRPVEQLAQDSYLGMTLRNVGRSSAGKHYHPHRKNSFPSSEPSSSESEYSGSESSTSSKGRHRRRRDNRHGRNKRRRRSSSSSDRLVIKPIAPKGYDGKADARKYHRFVRESDAYLRDGKVKGERRIFLLSHYLTDKAYDFYTQKVANDEANWSLSQFYDELFNYCFPVDYRMQLRKTLARCYQNDKSITEYTHELNELFNMIGDIPERDQVLKFWNGSRPVIQKGLWRDNLNPETSSWAVVVAQAEVIEISENVAERRDRKTGPSSQQSGGSGGPSGGSNRSRNRNTESSVRSVSYEPRTQTHSRTSGRNNHGSDNRASSSRGREGSQISHHSRGGTATRGRSQTPRSSNGGTPRLSEKEKAERLAAGQCFACGGTDHFSRDCPTRKIVKSTGGKPPRTTSFNIEPAINEDDSDGVEVLDGLPVGAIFIDSDGEITVLTDSSDEDDDVPAWPLNEWRDYFPFWNQRGVWTRRQIGDCYLMMADSILTLGQPYPGDEQFQVDNFKPYERFDIRIRRSECIVHDTLTDKRVKLNPALLRNPHFNITRWYAVMRVHALALDRSDADGYHGPMGSPVSIVAQKLLTDGSFTYYPCVRSDIDPNSRFSVCQSVLVDDQYVITDKDLKIHVPIGRDLLENPSFDLVGWYINYLSQRELYMRKKRTNTLHECSKNHSFTGCRNDGQGTGLGSVDDESDHGSMPDLESADAHDELDEETWVDDLPDLIPLPDDSEYGSDCEDGLNAIEQLDSAQVYAHLESWTDVLIA